MGRGLSHVLPDDHLRGGDVRSDLCDDAGGDPLPAAVGVQSGAAARQPQDEAEVHGALLRAVLQRAVGYRLRDVRSRAESEARVGKGLRVHA